MLQTLSIRLSLWWVLTLGCHMHTKNILDKPRTNRHTTLFITCVFEQSFARRWNCRSSFADLGFFFKAIMYIYYQQLFSKHLRIPSYLAIFFQSPLTVMAVFILSRAEFFRKLLAESSYFGKLLVVGVIRAGIILYPLQDFRFVTK